jgi:WhiB family redox-sensing transcriptional regulator
MSRASERDWMPKALCRRLDPELFFPLGKRETAPSKAQVAEAKAVCAVCPVRRECREYADTHAIEFGVYGGKDEWERREARQAHNIKRLKHAVVA